MRSRAPRVAHGAPRGGDGPRPHRQLGHVGLADQDRARLAQPRDDVGVGALGLAVGAGAEGRDLARDVGVVLDRDGHAEQRALLPAERRARRPGRPRRARAPRTRRGRRRARRPGAGCARASPRRPRARRPPRRGSGGPARRHRRRRDRSRPCARAYPCAGARSRHGRARRVHRREGRRDSSRVPRGCRRPALRIGGSRPAATRSAGGPTRSPSGCATRVARCASSRSGCGRCGGWCLRSARRRASSPSALAVDRELLGLGIAGGALLVAVVRPGDRGADAPDRSRARDAGGRRDAARARRRARCDGAPQRVARRPRAGDWPRGSRCASFPRRSRRWPC